MPGFVVIVALIYIYSYIAGSLLIQNCQLSCNGPRFGDLACIIVALTDLSTHPIIMTAETPLTGSIEAKHIREGYM